MATYSRILLLTILLISTSIQTSAEKWSNAPPPCNFPAIYNFGDSNSDTGGMSAAFGPIPPPYGQDFFHGPAGRESDGRLIIDFIAEYLGLPYLSSYLDSLGTNFRHGANFAAGGSTIRRQNETIYENGISPFSLDIQVTNFDQFKSRTSELFHRAKNPFDRSQLPRPREFSRALYTFDIGQNDILDGFRKLTMPQLKAALPDIVNHFASSIIHLYEKGARNFWIHNTGPLGCLPAATLYITNPKPGFFDNYGCIKSHNSMVIEFNKQLKSRIDKLRKQLRRASIIYVDVYSAKYHLISNTKYYGFTDPMKICCGRHESNFDVWCGQTMIINGSEIIGVSCSSPASYISWDGVHYSQAANQWVANHILNGSFSDPLFDVTHACLNH
ncbi:hypothetical protein ABFX02_11G128100 [Erythranthe guttata]